MKNYTLIFAAATLMISVACQKEIISSPSSEQAENLRTITVNLVPSEEMSKTFLDYEGDNMSAVSTLKWSDGDKISYWTSTDNGSNWGTSQEPVAINVSDGSFTVNIAEGVNKIKILYPPVDAGTEYDHTPDIFVMNQEEANKFNPAILRIKASVVVSEGENNVTAEYSTVSALVRWGLVGDGEQVSSFSMNLYNGTYASTIRTYTVNLTTPITLSSEPQYVYLACEPRSRTFLEPGSFTLKDGTTYYYVSNKQQDCSSLKVNSMTRVYADLSSENFTSKVEDLSKEATSNCYIVSSPGVYSFDASKQGCSTDDIVGTPAKAQLIWCFNETNTAQTNPASICKNISFKDNKITFLAMNDGSGNLVKGNYLIAVKDNTDNILWSWHIWATETPSDIAVHTPASGVTNWTLMDRNLGATWCDYAADTRDVNKIGYASGLFYQWGRKDPFLEKNWTLSNTLPDVATAIANPNVVYSNTSGSSTWMDPINNVLWKDDEKTKYDPCPIGYKVPKKDVFRFMAPYNTSTYEKSLVKEIDATTYKEGVFYTYTDSYTDKTNFKGEIRFPMGGQIAHNITAVGTASVGSRGDYWTSSADASTGKAFRVYFATDKFYNTSAHMDYGFAVRCVKQ